MALGSSARAAWLLGTATASPSPACLASRPSSPASWFITLLRTPRPLPPPRALVVPLRPLPPFPDPLRAPSACSLLSVVSLVGVSNCPPTSSTTPPLTMSAVPLVSVSTLAITSPTAASDVTSRRGGECLFAQGRSFTRGGWDVGRCRDTKLGQGGDGSGAEPRRDYLVPTGGRIGRGVRTGGRELLFDWVRPCFMQPQSLRRHFARPHTLRTIRWVRASLLRTTIYFGPSSYLKNIRRMPLQPCLFHSRSKMDSRKPPKWLSKRSRDHPRWSAKRVL